MDWELWAVSEVEWYCHSIGLVETGSLAVGADIEHSPGGASQMPP